MSAAVFEVSRHTSPISTFGDGIIAAGVLGNTTIEQAARTHVTSTTHACHKAPLAGPHATSIFLCTYLSAFLRDTPQECSDLRPTGSHQCSLPRGRIRYAFCARAKIGIGGRGDRCECDGARDTPERSGYFGSFSESLSAGQKNCREISPRTVRSYPLRVWQIRARMLWTQTEDKRSPFHTRSLGVGIMRANSNDHW